MGASPAHAGMDLISALLKPSSEGFPRTRGDGPCADAVAQMFPRLPPHTRGWTLTMLQPSHTHPASPAHAGMDRTSVLPGISGFGFPRTRGDGPPDGDGLGAAAALPPHTRGWTCVDQPGALAALASPAHAGMDRTSSPA